MLASLRAGHDSVWAISVGPVFAATSMLLGSAWTSSLVVHASLGPFDSPYAPVSVNRYSQEAAARFPLDMTVLKEFVATVPPNQAADVLETSGATGYYIMATGHQFLPVGGFTGVCRRHRREFKQLVVEGRVRRVTVTTDPLTRAPDLRWVVSHCTRTPESTYSNIERATRTVLLLQPPRTTNLGGLTKS